MGIIITDSCKYKFLYLQIFTIIFKVFFGQHVLTKHTFTLIHFDTLAPPNENCPLVHNFMGDD